MILPNLHDTIKNTILGYDCILAFETASDYLGTNKMAYRPKLCVSALQELDIAGVDCNIVDSYSDLEIVELDGIRCTSERQTIWDLLRYDRDQQVIIEAIADWYFKHNESFDGLDIPTDLQEVFSSFVDDAIYYFDD